MSIVNIVMKSSRDWSSKSKGSQFLSLLLNDEVLRPEKYAQWEPARYRLRPDDLDKPLNMWTTSHMRGLFVERTKPFRAWFSVEWFYRENNTFNELTGNVDERYFQKDGDVDKIISLMRQLCQWGQIDHGYICHEQDFSQKNLLPERTGGMRLQDELPGVYWLNFFGPTYVNFFGREKLLSAPAYYKEELLNGGFLILTAPSPLDFDKSEVHSLEIALRQHLGEEAFFDKALSSRRCLVPQFTFHQPVSGEQFITVDPTVLTIPDPNSFIEKASALSQQVAKKLRLDFSPESLSALDNYILRESELIREPESTAMGQQLLREVTAYYGEVLARNFIGRWSVVVYEDSHPQPTVQFKINGHEHEEMPFLHVSKLWNERQPSDGTATRFHLLQTGEWGKLENYLGTLPS